MKVSSALQKQATRDLAPIWEVNASVDPFDKLEDVPDGVWPMIIMDDIGFPGAAGIHLDRDGQPFALITAATELDRWALTASHEMCEMLVDPFGKKQVTGVTQTRSRPREFPRRGLRPIGSCRFCL
jgi:hypothetical protein